MTIVQPIVVDDADYTGGNLVENDTVDAPVWMVGEVISRGDLRRIEETHSIYEALEDHTASVANNPTTEAAALADPLTDDPSPRHWVYARQTNKYRLFDGRPSQRSEAPTPGEGEDSLIEVEVTLPGRISALAILELLDASSATVELLDDDGNSYWTRTVTLTNDSDVFDWESYFFVPNRLRDSYVAIDLPYTAIGDEIHLSITGGSGLACGQIVMGLGQEVGETQPGNTGAEGLDFSHVETNVYGDLVRVRRPSTNIHRFDVYMRSERVNAFLSLMRTLRGGELALFVGAEAEGLRAFQYGFVRDSQIYFTDAHSSRADITVQGIV